MNSADPTQELRVLANWRMKMIKAFGGRLTRLAMLASPLLKKMTASLAVGMAGVFMANGAVAFVPNGELSKVVRTYMYDDSLTPVTAIRVRLDIFFVATTSEFVK